jgi:hypothetical protein
LAPEVEVHILEPGEALDLEPLITGWSTHEVTDPPTSDPSSAEERLRLLHGDETEP